MDYEGRDQRLTINVYTFERVWRIAGAARREVDIGHGVVHRFDLEGELSLHFILIRLTPFTLVRTECSDVSKCHRT